MTKTQINTQGLVRTRVLRNRARDRAAMRLIMMTVIGASMFVSWTGYLLVLA